MSGAHTIVPLIGKWVRVTNPHGTEWEGRLVCWSADPSVVIEPHEGPRLCLSAGFKVEAAPEPPQHRAHDLVTVPRRDLSAVLMSWDRELVTRADREAWERTVIAAGGTITECGPGEPG